jgi:tetratricopeptide (TPR) repeat protein
LRLQPENVEINNDLGACLVNSGRAAEAIPYFEAALRLKPDSADAHYNLALALSQTPGRVRDAIPQYEAVLRLRPDYRVAQQGLELVRKKLGN